jgi:hypothetical protein
MPDIQKLRRTAAPPRRPAPGPLAWALRGLLGLLLLALVCFQPTPTYAQQEEWVERATAHFTILYTPGEEGTAQVYADFVDSVYDEMSTIFEHRTATPLTLRLYPTFESYYAVNPLARNMQGVVAHADFRKRELAVVLPQTQSQNPDQVRNNIRHELAHIIASELSDNQLNTGFQEGIAQYIELPTTDTDRKMQLLARSYANNTLMNWSDFENREMIYGTPEEGYPQSLAAVTFLIETYGFDQFRVFLVNSASSSGYRSALEQTYGASASELEDQWRSWIPTYLDGSFVQNAAGADLELNYSRRLLESGNYTRATGELEQAVATLREAQQQEKLAEAQQLLEASRTGQLAEQRATEAYIALQNADYAQARPLIEQARAGYASIGDTRQEQVLENWATHAERGLIARQQLAEANADAAAFRLPEAQAHADAAATEFQRLGDETRLNEALSLRESVHGMQRIAGLVLVGVGVLGIIASIWWRLPVRETEAW